MIPYRSNDLNIASNFINSARERKMVPSAFRTVSLRWKKLYPCSLVFRISNSSKPERSLDKKTPSITVLPVLSGGYNSLIDSAKQKNGLEKGDQFALALNEFLVREKYRRGHVAFIRIAMQRMDEFGLEKDLVTYNRILDIFPRGRFAPKSMIDAFWPRSTPQLELCLELLTKMEENGIRPSFETYDIVEVVFGRYSLPHEKCIRMMFLFDKYRDIDPYEIRSELPTDPVELSRLALFRMIGKDGQLMEIKVNLYSLDPVKVAIFNVCCSKYCGSVHYNIFRFQEIAVMAIYLLETQRNSLNS